MAKLIKDIGIGAKVKDSMGNIFTVVGYDLYGNSQATLAHYTCGYTCALAYTIHFTNNYETSYINQYLSGNYLNLIQGELREKILNTTIKYKDLTGKSSYTTRTFTTKAFVPSADEITGSKSYDGEYSIKIDYLSSPAAGSKMYWTRTEGYYVTSAQGHYYYNPYDSNMVTVARGLEQDRQYYVLPMFNISSSLLVTDSVSDGAYTFVFNEPPIIQNINNIIGNYGASTNITYIAKDNDDTMLNHYISFDNGATYTEIQPIVSGNNYTYSHVFDRLGTYYCRVKVVDGAGSEALSNVFTVSVNSASPTIDIVSVVGTNITFKVNCITSNILKVEIFVNNSIVEIYESGFNTNLKYNLDRNILNLSKNSIQIKATSEEGLYTFRNLEAIKEKYPLAPVGSKVIIHGDEYFVSKAIENGDYQTYTLTTNLLKPVKVGDIIKLSQDNVKVLCSLSSLEDVKDYKEMTLVKTKKLKGNLEGYVEERYELEGEGRYSTIKLELEKFNMTAQTEVLELQQYFDYKED
jgi:hypothetical protein